MSNRRRIRKSLNQMRLWFVLIHILNMIRTWIMVRRWGWSRACDRRRMLYIGHALVDYGEVSIYKDTSSNEEKNILWRIVQDYPLYHLLCDLPLGIDEWMEKGLCNTVVEALYLRLYNGAWGEKIPMPIYEDKSGRYELCYLPAGLAIRQLLPKTVFGWSRWRFTGIYCRAGEGANLGLWVQKTGVVTGAIENMAPNAYLLLYRKVE